MDTNGGRPQRLGHYLRNWKGIGKESWCTARLLRHLCSWFLDVVICCLAFVAFNYSSYDGISPTIVLWNKIIEVDCNVELFPLVMMHKAILTFLIRMMLLQLQEIGMSLKIMISIARLLLNVLGLPGHCSILPVTHHRSILHMLYCHLPEIEPYGMKFWLTYFF